jgi:hypothetical protein
MGFYAFEHGDLKEGCLLLFGFVLQFLVGVYAWVCPKNLEPRQVKTRRFYVLHTGMTTRHLLVLAHNPSFNMRSGDPEKPYINLEDAAVPLPYISKGKAQSLCGFVLRWTIWIYLAACAFWSSETFLIPLTFLIGNIIIEFLSSHTTALPRYSHWKLLQTTKTHPNLMDLILAVCQETGSVSTGFVEQILPDRKGVHFDHNWISSFMKGPLSVGAHPNHESSNVVFSAGLLRHTDRVSILHVFVSLPRNSQCLRPRSSSLF